MTPEAPNRAGVLGEHEPDAGTPARVGPCDQPLIHCTERARLGTLSIEAHTAFVDAVEHHGNTAVETWAARNRRALADDVLMGHMRDHGCGLGAES